MTTKITVPWPDFKQVRTIIKESGVKHFPFRKKHTSYEIEFITSDPSLISLLLLKYDGIKVIQN